MPVLEYCTSTDVRTEYYILHPYGVLWPIYKYRGTTYFNLPVEVCRRDVCEFVAKMPLPSGSGRCYVRSLCDGLYDSS